MRIEQTLFNLIPIVFQCILKSILFFCFTKKIILPRRFKYIWVKDIINKRIVLWDKVDIWFDNIISWNVEIWDYSFLNFPWTRLNASPSTSISVWKFCSISWNVSIVSKNEHHMNEFTTFSRLIKLKDIWSDVVIWHDVRIWSNAIILPWINIWTWAVIWAWSVVTKDVPPYSVVVWNPWKIIKYRFDKDKIDLLLKEKRRDNDIEDIVKNLKWINQKQH